jgi:fatty-acyl-CoA synthase
VTGPATIPEALFATAERGGGGYVFHLEGGEVHLSYPELAERALSDARRLLARGVGPGDAVGVLGPNRPEWVIAAFATWIAGAVLVPLQLPLRIRDEAVFREQLLRLVEAGDCRCVIVEPGLAPLLTGDLAMAWNAEGGEGSAEPVLPAADDDAVIQFTSGSTAVPRGARIAHRAVMAQIDLLRHAYRHADGSPRVVLNWGPFFHDLGLFANLAQPAAIGATVHQLPTDLFAGDPAEWLRLVSATRATITVAPSAAFGSALRAVARRGERVDLSSLEAALFAAESVDPAVARRLLDSADDLWLDPRALGSTYGLAEAVMAVAYSTVGTGLRLDRVSLPELTGAGRAVPSDGDPVKTLVSCGPPRMDLRIGAPGGDLPERHVGEILVRGASSMSGYAGPGAEDPFAGGWLRTGDLGYIAGGELFVTGRQKDVMIAMGHNYYPEDFEWAAARVEGIRPGRCVAFNLSGGEEVVVLAETANGAGHDDLVRRLRSEISLVVGVPPDEVVLLPPGRVEKTTSGKLRRGAMREAYLSGTLGS